MNINIQIISLITNLIIAISTSIENNTNLYYRLHYKTVYSYLKQLVYKTKYLNIV